VSSGLYEIVAPEILREERRQVRSAPSCALVIDNPAFVSQQGGYPEITAAAVPAGQDNNMFSQEILIIG